MKALATLILLLLCTTPANAAGQAGGRLLLAHYMPWYASEPFSGAWGWHWTMGHFDPDAGEQASHERPLIGLYDSLDPAALECQVLQMKLAGIDGVIIDWYGIADHFDYARIQRASQLLVAAIKRAGLRFAVCYEDRTIEHLVAADKLAAADSAAHAAEVMAWLQEHWFGDPAYVRVDGQPLLLVFGPTWLRQPSQWEAALAACQPRPRLYSLGAFRGRAGADGIFAWPPVQRGEPVPAAVWQEHLQATYATISSGTEVIPCVFPAFHDIYAEAGLHASYGHIPERDGATFADSLALAWESGARIVQLVTWNDYGEGTVIEPTERNGYRYLERLLDLRRQVDADDDLLPDHLRLPAAIYRLRQSRRSDAALQARLDGVVEHLLAGEWAQAESALQEAQR